MTHSTNARMSPAARSWLSDTVRALRQRLIKDLKDGLESSYPLSIAPSRAHSVLRDSVLLRLKEGDEQANQRLLTQLKDNSRIRLV